MPCRPSFLACAGLLLAGSLSLAGCGGTDYFHATKKKVRDPRPPAGAISDGLVQASGGQQNDGGLVEHDCIVGEPFATGTVVTGGTREVRHGFWMPLVPMAPFGLAWVVVRQPDFE